MSTRHRALQPPRARRLAAWSLAALVLSTIPTPATAARAQARATALAPRALLLDSPVALDRAQDPPPERRPWLAIAEVTALNVLVWSADRFVRDRDWAQISLESWESNLSSGLAWDADRFDVNELAHPYHGALYFNAARANGFGYWGSVPFALLGTMEWELFLENEPPSANDSLNTPLGGMVIGETLYRFSSLLLDNGAHGWDRVRHEVLAGLVNPMRGINRLLTGEAWENASNPPQQYPLFLGARLQAGGLFREATTGSNRLFLEAAVDYGDPFRSELREPFDAFVFDLRLGGAEDRLISHLDIAGILAARPLVAAGSERLLLTGLQEIEYWDNPSYKLAAQAFNAALLLGHAFPEAGELRAALSLRGLVLAAVSSEHAQATRRTYDYGPGLGLQASLWYGRWPWGLLRLKAGVSWIHSINGARGSHLIEQLGFQGDVPLYQSVGIGASIDLFRRDSLYADFPSAHRTTPELRLFLSIH